MFSTTQARRHTPSWLSARGDAAPVYLLRTGSVVERASFEAELTAQQAGRVFAGELVDAFSSGVRLLLDDVGDQEHLIGLAQAEAFGATDLDDADRQLLRDAKDELGRYWPDYRALRSRLDLRRELIPILAFARFCVGWDNVEAKFERGMDGMIKERSLKGVDPLEMMSAGNEAYSMLYAIDPVGNSAPPSTSDDGQAPISSGGDTAKAG
jgi:hypothetical protein